MSSRRRGFDVVMHALTHPPRISASMGFTDAWTASNAADPSCRVIPLFSSSALFDYLMTTMHDAVFFVIFVIISIPTLSKNICLKFNVLLVLKVFMHELILLIERENWQSPILFGVEDNGKLDLWSRQLMPSQSTERKKAFTDTSSRGRYPALGHFSSSNFFKLLLAEIWKNKINDLKGW